MCFNWHFLYIYNAYIMNDITCYAGKSLENHIFIENFKCGVGTLNVKPIYTVSVYT